MLLVLTGCVWTSDEIVRLCRWEYLESLSVYQLLLK